MSDVSLAQSSISFDEADERTCELKIFNSVSRSSSIENISIADSQQDSSSSSVCDQSAITTTTTTSSSSIHGELIEAVAGKKRQRMVKDYLVTIPRMDIRRMYPQMIMNIFNSHNPHLVLSFFTTYSLPNMTGSHQMSELKALEGQLSTRPTTPVSASSSSARFLDSSNRMALFYAIMLQLNPDQVMRLQYATINVLPEKKLTEIVCVTHHEFTQLYAVHPMQVTDDIIEYLVHREIETLRSRIQRKRQQMQTTKSSSEMVQEPEESPLVHVSDDVCCEDVSCEEDQTSIVAFDEDESDSLPELHNNSSEKLSLSVGILPANRHATTSSASSTSASLPLPIQSSLTSSSSTNSSSSAFTSSSCPTVSLSVSKSPPNAPAENHHHHVVGNHGKKKAPPPPPRMRRKMSTRTKIAPVFVVPPHTDESNQEDDNTSSEDVLLEDGKEHPPPQQQHKVSSSSIAHKDSSSSSGGGAAIVFPNTFELYQQMHAHNSDSSQTVPLMPTPVHIRIVFDMVIVVDALRRIVSVDMRNPQIVSALPVVV